VCVVRESESFERVCCVVDLVHAVLRLHLATCKRYNGNIHFFYFIFYVKG